MFNNVTNILKTITLEEPYFNEKYLRGDNFPYSRFIMNDIFFKILRCKVKTP